MSDELDALRWRIATRYGLGEDDAADLLTGADEAAMTRQAQRLAELRKPPIAQHPGPFREDDQTDGITTAVSGALALNSAGLEGYLAAKLGGEVAGGGVL